MGSTVAVTIVPNGTMAVRDLHAHAQDRIAVLEQRWSRFIPSSEICGINAAAGEWVSVSRDTTRLVRRAIDAWELTDGAFDPTILPALVALGYTESIEIVRAAPRDCGRPASAPGCGDIEVSDDRVRLPPGVQFDPGGIGKGMTGDIVVEEVSSRGAEGVCVEVGGDVRVVGDGPEGRGWVVRIADPDRSRPDLARVWLTDGAVASSSTKERRWVAGNQEVHHLIDPATGLPTAVARGASVLASDGWLAEALSTAACVTGSLADVERVGGAALLVTGDATVVRSAQFGRYEI